MTTMKKVQTCIAFMAILIASTGSIPVAVNEQLTNVMEPFGTREEMTIRYRLPKNTIPRLYKISIEPNMEDDNLTWIGETGIDIEVLEATPILTLHAYKNLVIDERSTELVDANDTKLKPIEQLRDEQVELLKLKFDRDISVGNYSLNFKYQGTDVQDKVGFYKLPFKSPEIPIVAGTHFEATTARRAFPCWDEPSFKARFRMSIKHFPNYTAISNMPEIESVSTTNGKVLTTFDTTPIMPTYLLTFVIGDYGNISNEHGNVTLWGERSVLGNMNHILEFSPKVVDVMEKYTGLSYGFPRIGSVLLAVYSATATEHWGLVTYIQRMMEFDRATDTRWHVDPINLLIAHELAHSWFGNRVSPVWWDDLWLNEAFAAYFQYLIVDEILENWNGVELFVLRNNHELSFRIDNDWAIPVKWTPITNREIRYLFGQITYRKGAAIVHMFRNVLTDDVFRAGIRKYLTKHSFGSASAEDLARAFQEAHDEGINAEQPLNVNETMSSWLMQAGYPLINVSRNYTTGLTEVAQESTLTGNSSTNKWWVPLTYATQSSLNFSSTVPSKWISDTESNVTIEGIGKNDWVIFNVRASGFYRVNYDEENWNRIADYLNTDNYKNIHVLNRMQLFSDACYMFDRDEERFFKIVFKLTKYLYREVDYLPWRAAKYHCFSTVDNILHGTELDDFYQRYVLGLMNGLIEKVGFEARDDDDHLTILSRSELVKWACVSGHSGCAEFAAEKLVKLVENGTNYRLHPDTEAFIFCAGLRGLNDTNAKKVVAWALENDRKLLVVLSLGCTENHEIHEDFLLSSMAKNSSTTAREIHSALRLIAEGNDGNFNYAVDFFLRHHETLKYLAKPNSWSESFRDTFVMLVYQIKTAARSEKFKSVMKLDTVIGNKDINTKHFQDIIDKNVEKSGELVAKYRNFWYQQVSADNTINNAHPEAR